MPNNVVLSAIRSLLRFKDYTTISEIASIAQLPKKHVLNVINTNGAMIYRDRAYGRITRETVRFTCAAKLYEDGKYFKTYQENYGAITGLQWSGHPELKAELQEDYWCGGLGDCYKIKIVMDTPENRARLAAVGIMPYNDETMADDRLWKEADNA